MRKYILIIDNTKTKYVLQQCKRLMILDNLSKEIYNKIYKNINVKYRLILRITQTVYLKKLIIKFQSIFYTFILMKIIMINIDNFVRKYCLFFWI